MEANKTLKYHLTAFPLSEESLKMAETQRFYRVTEKYILIYSLELSEGAIEVTDAEYDLLTTSEKEWLADCNVVILLEFEREHKEAVERGRKELADKIASYIKEMGIENVAE